MFLCSVVDQIKVIILNSIFILQKPFKVHVYNVYVYNVYVAPDRGKN